MKHTDRTELIAGLNEDLAHEYASVIQYRTFASMVRGPHRPTLRPMFVAEIADELGHAGLLADHIVALGGVPTTTPKSVAVAENAEAMLRSVHEAESAALARYVERRRMAETLGEHALVVALDDVIADEARHRDEIRLVLDGWPAAADRGQLAATEARRPASQSARRADDRAADVPMAARGPDQPGGHRR